MTQRMRIVLSENVRCGTGRRSSGKSTRISPGRHEAFGQPVVAGLVRVALRRLYAECEQGPLSPWRPVRPPDNQLWPDILAKMITSHDNQRSLDSAQA
jgi:hypothetical protein